MEKQKKEKPAKVKEEHKAMSGKKIALIVVGGVVLAVIMLVAVLFAIDHFGPATYTAASSFLYSADKGHTYGNGTKEYTVGETVYMKVQYNVISDKAKTSQVRLTLTIPNVQNVDAKYMDGQVITPNYDPVQNITTYEFTANASKDAPGSECVFQFIPNAVGSITMTLIYDDSIDSSYDKQSTLIFVEPETAEE